MGKARRGARCEGDLPFLSRGRRERAAPARDELRVERGDGRGLFGVARDVLELEAVEARAVVLGGVRVELDGARLVPDERALGRAVLGRARAAPRVPLDVP